MQIMNLTQDKLEEFMPYLDTLVVPVCSIRKSDSGVPDNQDVLFVRSCTEQVDGHLSGRILVLPEVIHTSVKTEESGGDCQQATAKADSCLTEFLFSAVMPYADMGVSSFILLYSSGTENEPMEQLLSKLSGAGVRAAAFRLDSTTEIDRFIVPEIINLWSEKSTNS
jgi:creatinine amidohydrolase